MRRYFERILLAFSILFNTMLGGSTNQSFSARNWGWRRAGYPNLVWLIDIIFFWEKQHCVEAWIKWTIINNALRDYNSIGEKVMADMQKKVDSA